MFLVNVYVCICRMLLSDHLSVRIHIHAHVYIYIYIYLYLYTYVHIHPTCTHKHIVCMCIHVYTYIFTHTYIYTHIFLHLFVYLLVLDHRGSISTRLLGLPALSAFLSTPARASWSRSVKRKPWPKTGTKKAPKEYTAIHCIQYVVHILGYMVELLCRYIYIYYVYRYVCIHMYIYICICTYIAILE